jgi:hypothetical protein
MTKRKHSTRPIRLTRRLEDTIDVTLELNAEEIELRVEIFSCAAPRGHYCARLWRYEYYRIQSTFPQADGLPRDPPSDELILKEFEGMDSPLRRPKAFRSVGAARDHVLAEIARWLREQVGVTGGQ